MSPVHPLLALAAPLLALATAGLLALRFGAPSRQQRCAPIDGLRGCLAFAVFLSHASVWYYLLRNGRWDLPPSLLYTHLGQSGVTLFFMITGFLFFARLLDGHSRSIDGLRLYVSRSLPYEWFHYLMLPVLGLLIGLRSPLGVLLIALATALFAWRQPLTLRVTPAFPGGMVAALLVRVPTFTAIAARPVLAFVVLALALIAGGNTVFGVLVSPAARTLGEMADSLYPLHGMVLYVAFRASRWLLIPETLSPLGHWLLIFLLTPLLVLLCRASFRCIEHPAMQSVGAVSAGLRRRSQQISHTEAVARSRADV